MGAAAQEGNQCSKSVYCHNGAHMSDDILRIKMEQLAIRVADSLLSEDIELDQRIDGLKTLSGYYAAVKRVDRDSGHRDNGSWGRLQRSINGGSEDDYGETDEA
jgi:hypothetical protein